MKPALILAVDRAGAAPALPASGQLYFPETRLPARVPLIIVKNPEAIQLFDGLKPGPTEATVTLHLAEPWEKKVILRNVIGLLRGSDPILKDTYALVTAHYDHVGVKPGGEGDRIYNGANDDGSGTVSVIELASALASLKQHPKRSIVFMTFFGEEKGGYGSLFYARHPIFPIGKTIADVNLEQMGRTDSSEGPELENATFTGYDLSDLPRIFQSAGELTGIRVYQQDSNDDSYFSRSDNKILADQGIPAHTVTVAFSYPDYHGLGDEWQKIDYANMAKVDRMVALGLIMLGNDSVPPKWNESNPSAAQYLKAWKEHQR